MRRKIPSLQALACFEAAARHESYTRAGAELAMTQGAVSRQIATLEGFLGLKLFRRTQHGVALTAAGTDYARQVGARLDALERDTLDAMAHQGRGGALQIATVPTFATRWLLPRLPRLAHAQPDVVVHLETRTRPFLFTDTPFDAALYAGTPEQVASWAGTRAQRLMDEVVVPVCSPALAQALRPRRGRLGATQLAQAPLLQQSTRPDAWRQWFEAQGVACAQPLAGPRHELFSMLAVAAAQGMGVALMPTMFIANELARGELVVIDAPPLTGLRAYYLVTPDLPASPASPALAGFAQWLAQEAALVIATAPPAARSP